MAALPQVIRNAPVTQVQSTDSLLAQMLGPDILKLPSVIIAKIISGGGGKPVQLIPLKKKPNALNVFSGTWWANKFNSGDTYAAIDTYNNGIKDFNKQSAEIAAKYGYNSTKYQTWLKGTLPGQLTGGPGSGGETSAQAVNDASGSPLGNPLNTVGDFLGVLTTVKTWVRVGEFVAGGVCLLGGIVYAAKALNLTVPTPLQGAANALRKVTK